MIKPNVFDYNFLEQIRLFNQGNNYSSYEFLGSKKIHNYVRFAVWAPNAKKVSLIGDFNNWTEEPMTKIEETGIWIVFNENAKVKDCYKYRVYDNNNHFVEKIDPFSYEYEIPPKDASIIRFKPDFKWEDQKWMRSRKRINHFQKPINIYEVHATSWKRHEDNSSYSFYDLANELIPYVKKMNYTHIELMPIMDHPLEASWGYQITGYFAVAGRFGDLDSLAYFINEAHKQNIGVILDWVPGHYCANQNALAYFDGTPTFEYDNDWQAKNIRWGTLNFDLGKDQVHSFLISNALFWIKELHIDGLRIDAVSNMIYLDYDEGYWEVNEDGNNLNKEGIEFLQNLNNIINENYPEVIMIAEESTAFKNVTKSTANSGLGFDYKWNMGWMNDTLTFFEQNSYNRNHSFNLINFNFVYMQDENFMLPLSHDEVVHGKKSILGRVDGSRQQQFEQLRLLQTYMMSMPGKKLNFMGNEIGQFLEWRFYDQVEWDVLNYDFNSEFHTYIQSLNEIYLNHNALFFNDFNKDKVEIVHGDAPLVTLIRHGKNERDFLIFVHNFSHYEIDDLRISVLKKGSYEVILNSALEEFGGYWKVKHDLLRTDNVDDGYFIELIVPAMSSLIIKPKRLLK